MVADAGGCAALSEGEAAAAGAGGGTALRAGEAVAGTVGWAAPGEGAVTETWAWMAACCWRTSIVANPAIAAPINTIATMRGVRRRPLPCPAGALVSVGAWMVGALPIWRSACAFFSASRI